MSSNNWVIKCLAMLWVQARWLSKLDLGPAIKEQVDPADTWLSTTQSLSLFSDSLLVERVSRIREKNDPINKHTLCLRGKKLLLDVCLVTGCSLPQKLVTKCMVRDHYTVMCFKHLTNSHVLGLLLTSKDSATLLYDIFHIMGIGSFLPRHVKPRRSHLAPDTSPASGTISPSRCRRIIDHHFEKAEFKLGSTIVMVKPLCPCISLN
jgi:hypothetical protein